MEPYTIELLPEKKTIHAVLTQAWVTREYTPRIAEDFVELMDSLSEPFFLLVDFTPSSWDLTDVIFASNYAARIGITFLQHANMREFLAVTTDNLIALGAKGMNSSIFGNVPVSVFNTVESALAHAGQLV